MGLGRLSWKSSNPLVLEFIICYACGPAKILQCWDKINADVTIVPVSIGRYGGTTKFMVKTWKDEYRSPEPIEHREEHTQYSYRSDLKSGPENVGGLVCQC